MKIKSIIKDFLYRWKYQQKSSELEAEKKNVLSVYSDEKLEEYSNRLEKLKNEYSDTPFLVSIETFALCNAKCEFCPSHQLERKGQRIDRDVFLKIIKDLSGIDVEKQPIMVLARVNEPFLDKNIFDFFEIINESLLGSKHLIFTNGSPLDEGKLDRLLKVDDIALLNISLNEIDKTDYQRVMSLDYNKTIQNIERVHLYKKSGKITFPVRISRVADGTSKDTEFISYIKDRFPLFETSLISRVNWLGMVSNDKVPEFAVPDIACAQWYEMQILSNGKTSFCCIDSTGEYSLGGDIMNENILDMYNSPARLSLRSQLTSRKQHHLCKKCSLLS